MAHYKYKPCITASKLGWKKKDRFGKFVSVSSEEFSNGLEQQNELTVNLNMCHGRIDVRYYCIIKLANQKGNCQCACY